MPAPISIHHRNRTPAHVYLREWLDYRGLTAEQLAGRIEAGKSAISKMMNRKQRYNTDVLEEIAYALNCEVHQLFRPPTAPTANELLEKMTPEARETAMKVLVDLSQLKTGT